MADTTTLAQQPKEKVRNAAALDPVFGGFEGIWEIATRGDGKLVNEAPNLEQIRQMPEHQIEVSRFSPEGTIRGFHEQRGIEDVYPEFKNEWRAEQTAEQLKAWRMHIAKAPIEEKRVNINELNALQVLYRGSVDDEGNITAYHEANAARKNSELTEKGLQEKRQAQLVQATNRKVAPKAAVSGQNDLLFNASAQEGQSMTSSASSFRGAG